MEEPVAGVSAGEPVMAGLRSRSGVAAAGTSQVAASAAGVHTSPAPATTADASTRASVVTRGCRLPVSVRRSRFPARLIHIIPCAAPTC